jgi:hypothetical protein
VTLIDAVQTKVGDALDRCQFTVSRAGDSASEMAGMATHQVRTFASELETIAKSNALGTMAGAVVVDVLHRALGAQPYRLSDATELSELPMLLSSVAGGVCCVH